MHRFLKFLGLIALLLVGGCTVSGNDGRFQRTGFPGLFEPSVTVIVDTKFDRVWVIGGGSAVDGALAAALRRPSQVNVSASADADAAADAASEATGGNGNNGHGHGHGEGHDED